MRSILMRFGAALRASPWFTIALRVVGALAALIVLACVGHYVAVGGAVPPAAAAVPPPIAAPPTVSAAVLAAPSSLGIDAGTEVPAPMPHGPHATTDDPVYLNEASLDDLRRLPGIGQKRALAILELRGKLGHFRQIEDLLRVKGIGRAALKKLRLLVRIERADGGAS